MSNKKHFDNMKIAHVVRKPDGSWRKPHELVAHLAGVAALAACHARHFAAEDWAHLAGLWHDLGKYRPAFQNYIRKASGYEAEDAHIEGAGRVDHSTTGAVHAIQELGDLAGRVLAYLIAGHHAGLPDWNGDNSSLFQRLEAARKAGWLGEVLDQRPPDDILHAVRPDGCAKGSAEDLHLWLRMLFSSLVDADFLDTEAYMNPEQGEARASYPAVADLLEHFGIHMEGLATNAPLTSVNRVRADVLRQCIERAAEARGNGLYSLTVPTGGGKTLSSLAFALHHAAHHKKRRVIYAIPYLSIIEQTADVFHGIFGEEVVEHHSNLDPDKESLRSRLAAENWDAPLIVTTNMQLFESLFAARPSRCRKLHNLVDSVIILDEAQLLPPEFLDPCLAAMRTLSKHYGVTFVLCTATQPAFNPREINGRPFAGLPDVRELMQGGPYVHEPTDLYRDLDRVRVHWPNPEAATSFEEIAQRIFAQDQTLAVVNRKAHARALAKKIPGALYLSTDLCGAHRAERIQEIRIRLAANRARENAGLSVCPLHVVSTQLIEAGVDVDFPEVFRAMAGVDAIAQAAGRCNREGLLMRGDEYAKGNVHVFVAPEPAPSGLLLKGELATRELLSLTPKPVLAPELFERYFRIWFASINSMDKEGILDLLKPGKGLELSFRTAAEKFRLIPDEGLPVIVRWGEADKWLNTLRAKGPDRWLMRKLQRYSVTVRRHCVERLLAVGDLEELMPGIYQAHDMLYDDTFGFVGCTENLVPAPSRLAI